MIIIDWSEVRKGVGNGEHHSPRKFARKGKEWKKENGKGKKEGKKEEVRRNKGEKKEKRNLKNYFKINVQVIFLEIYQLSIMRYPP